MSSSLLWTNKVFLTFLDLLTLTLVSLKRSDRPNSLREVGRRTQTVLVSLSVTGSLIASVPFVLNRTVFLTQKTQEFGVFGN